MIETLQNVITEVFIGLFNTGMTWTLNIFLMTFNFFLGGLSSGLSRSWSNPIVEVFLYIANTASITIFTFSLLFFFLKISQEEKHNWHAIFKCMFNAMIFVFFNQYMVKLCFLIPDMFVSLLNKDISYGSPDTLIFNFSFLISWFASVGMLITLLYFVYTTVARFGLMFI